MPVPLPTDHDVREAKQRICEVFGVSLEEVEALDRAMGGPEQRAARAAAEKDVLNEIDTALERMSDDLGTVFGQQVRLVLVPRA